MDEPEFEERKQTEVADGLRCWTEGTEYGRGGKLEIERALPEDARISTG